MNAVRPMGKMVLLVACCCLAKTAIAQDVRKENFQRAMILTLWDKQTIQTIDRDGKLENEYPVQSRCTDAWKLKDGNILYVDFENRAVKVTSGENETVFEYKFETEIDTCQPLPDGSIVVGVCDEYKPRIVELSRDGQIRKEVPLQAPVTSDHPGQLVHHQIQKVRKLQNGNYLVCQTQMGLVREYDETGKIAWEFELKDSNPWCAVRLTSGNTLIGTGYYRKKPTEVLEVSPDNKIVWTLENSDLPKHFGMVRTIYDIQRLSNGNTVVFSFIWTTKGEKGVDVFEITPQKEVVWEFDHPELLLGMFITDEIEQYAEFNLGPPKDNR